MPRSAVRLPARQSSGLLRFRATRPTVAKSPLGTIIIALLRNGPAGGEFSSPRRKLLFGNDLESPTRPRDRPAPRCDSSIRSFKSPTGRIWGLFFGTHRSFEPPTIRVAGSNHLIEAVCDLLDPFSGLRTASSRPFEASSRRLELTMKRPAAASRGRAMSVRPATVCQLGTARFG